MYINGGTLFVGNGEEEVLFVGQYEDAEGTVTLDSGAVNVQGELAVAVSGKGTWVQESGTVSVRDRFVIGRYSKVEAVGTVLLRGGSIVADRFDMNEYSQLTLEGGILVLYGNHISKVQGHIDSGRITGGTGPAPTLFYDEVSARTYLYSNTNVQFTNYYGQAATTSPFARRMLRVSSHHEEAKKRSLAVTASTTDGFPSWFDPLAWQPQGIPGPLSEVWMNSLDTAALIAVTMRLLQPTS